MKKLLVYLTNYKKECVVAPAFKMLEALFDLFVPLVMAKIIDVGIPAGDTGYILRRCGVLVLLGVVGLACSIVAQYFAAKAAVGFSTGVRHALFARIQSLSCARLEQEGTATLITRMTSDVNQAQNGVNMVLRLFLRSPFIVFGALILAFTIDRRAALIFAAVIPVLFLIVFGIMAFTIPGYRKVQGKLDGVMSVTRENLTGVRVVRAFHKEEEEQRRFERANAALNAEQQRVGRISSLMNPLTYVVINLAVVLLVRVGAIRVQQGILTQGLVIALYNYMSQILIELIKMANLIVTIAKAVACGNRISAVLKLESDQENGTDEGKLSGSVEFRDVSAAYAGAASPSLEHISFRAEPGQCIGIIGGTGSGKTTLVNLIPRLYDASEGQVLLDGKNVKDFDLNSLRRQIGVVPQKAVLFKGTIRQNLLWGNENASEEALWDALKVAQAQEVVQGKEGGLDASVEQGGANFSGGQRQRLTIARALVRKPAILILDDSASALDFATDANLRMAIRGMENPPTTFIVSQRAASVRFADEILVLDDGNLVGKGTHDKLLADCPTYQEIYYSQFPKEVAAHE